METMDYTSGNNHFDTPVQYLPGVGPKSAKKLAKLGVATIGDLIYFFPRKYLDYTDTISIAMINDQFSISKEVYNVTIKARITHISNKKTRRRGFTVTEAEVEDGTGTIKVVWFNQPYLPQMLHAGREIILHGKVAWDFFNETYSMESPDWAEKPKIVPIYRETDGVTSHYIAKIVAKVAEQMGDIEEFLPDSIVKENDLLRIDEAVRILHAPKDMAELDRARERMAFDELFMISLRGQVLKAEIEQERAPVIEARMEDLDAFKAKLPFKLTGDQEKAIEDILNDLAANVVPGSLDLARDDKEETGQYVRPMNRLLNGDVGSGKTIVAAIAAYLTVKAGRRVIIMAPTEILANQHYETFAKLLTEYGIEIKLVTSSQNKSENRMSNDEQNIKSKPKSPDIYIGTHALLYMKEAPVGVGLVIVDEQHRFGVRQRAELQKMSNLMLEKNKRPHFLSMTATPIPRSLQLVLFGELNVSVIEEKPADRREIKTRVVDETNRRKAYDFIRAHVKAGRQVFIVCPLIEETQNLKPLAQGSLQEKTQNENIELFEIDRKTVVSEYEKLSKEIFPDLRIGMLHGKMKSKEKDEIMTRFSSRELDILVSTSVVEVGVDIPNASVMMIEDAERFGLAQLHQFRGRVGRGEHQSFCFLFTSSQNPVAIERLRGLERTSDGFKLAELDLKTRGAGDIFGSEQSGFMDIRFADLSNSVLIAKASKAAKQVAESDPGIKNHPAINRKLGQFLDSKHFE